VRGPRLVVGPVCSDAHTFLMLFYVGLAISLTPIYPVTWRLARRFGWRGLAVFIGIVTVIGPPRDYLYADDVPEVDGIRTGRCSDRRGRRDLCGCCSCGPCRHASYRRPRQPGPLSATTTVAA
jgi:hypothetical protein